MKNEFNLGSSFNTIDGQIEEQIRQHLMAAALYGVATNSSELNNRYFHFERR
jgi:hypothetical protein